MKYPPFPAKVYDKAVREYPQYHWRLVVYNGEHPQYNWALEVRWKSWGKQVLVEDEQPQYKILGEPVDHFIIRHLARAMEEKDGTIQNTEREEPQRTKKDKKTVRGGAKTSHSADRPRDKRVQKKISRPTPTD